MHHTLGVPGSQLNAACCVAVRLADANADRVGVQFRLSKPHADRLRAEHGLAHALALAFWVRPESEPPGPVLQPGAHCVYCVYIVAANSMITAASLCVEMARASLQPRQRVSWSAACVNDMQAGARSYYCFTSSLASS